MAEELEGYVQKILFSNKENGYHVFTLELAGEEKKTGMSEEEVVVGTFPDIDEGDYLKITGEHTEHARHGLQFKAFHYERCLPEGVDAIEKYLGSGAIKGIGPAMAKKIVKVFKEDTFRVLEEEPECLAKVKGIGEKKAREIAAQMNEKKNLRSAMMFLQQYGISLNLSAKIYQKYGDELYNVIRQNPYKLADDIEGVGFKTADEIAAKAGISPDSDFRIQSGMLYVLQKALSNGNTYLPKSQFMKEACELLLCAESEIEKNLQDMQIDRRIIVKIPAGKEENDMEPQIYSATYYYMELNTAKHLYDLNLEEKMDKKKLEKEIEEIEKEENIVLDKMQREAVLEAVTHGLTIITGGPGTGKTTTINTIIRYFDQMGLTISLAAPTGRAAKRMTEATGFEAQTIHRLLELSGGPEGEGGRIVFGRNDENPLEADVIIIDEMSMVDIFIMNSLLKAVAVGTRLILVGDVDQLPSVGPGNVLRDIIDSNCFRVVKLNKIFRQATESDIIVNAHKINRGEIVEPKMGSRDFLFVKREDAQRIIGATITLVREKLPPYVNAKPKDIQVLTPMRRGPLGVENLNTVLQYYLNPADPSKEEKETISGIFREGDKVMQIRNNYQMEWEIVNRYGVAVQKGVGVFNGDVGIIKSMNHYAEEMVVEFEEGRMATYTYRQLEELELAYAVTIHKSQGSEYPAIVLPLLSGPKMLMTRNLLYTAVTRAKTCVTIVGSVETFQDMIRNKQERDRYSGLDARIRDVFMVS